MVLRSYESQPTDGEARIVSCRADELREPVMMNGSRYSPPGVSDRSSDEATTRITLVIDVNDEDARRLRVFVQSLMERRS